MRGKFTGIDEIALSSPVERSEGPGRRRLELMRVQAAWRLAVGPRLRLVSRVRACRDGALSVDVRDKVWLQEIRRHEQRVLTRMAGLLSSDSVSRINFRVWVEPGQPDDPAETIAAAETKPEPDPPGDEPRGARYLRERFDEVMKRYLSRGDRTRG